ncbi:hypothetical protein GCM10010191_79210 [Actinomadura vinacea]|uniref:Alpha/beta hydrolase n=1 Tax=Actinomadura vinacea TaxID=115336 RepID=A0ABP5XGF1_9ACTN
MTPTIVFVHGRAQEFRDPAALALEWVAGLNAGLTKAGLATIRPEQVVLPHYGNVLYEITARLSQPPRLEVLPDGPGAPGPLHPELPADVGETERSLLADMAAVASLDTAGPEARMWTPDRLLSWDLARRVLVDLARRTRVDQEIISAHLRDVAVYLTRGRAEVLAAVRAGLPPNGPVVLVTHSLGTVVGRDLLDDAGLRSRTLAWITAGSPLGLEAVQRNMNPPGARHPGPTVEWVSAYDVNDIVALGHPLRPMYGEPLRDVQVENGDRPHAIDRYLGHAEVARPIGEAVSRG